MKGLLLAWAALVPMSLASVWLGDHGQAFRLTLVAILLLALGKGWIIALEFMELRHAPRLWRGLLLGWPLALAAVILTIHLTN